MSYQILPRPLMQRVQASYLPKYELHHANKHFPIIHTAYLAPKFTAYTWSWYYRLQQQLLDSMM